MIDERQIVNLINGYSLVRDYTAENLAALHEVIEAAKELEKTNERYAILFQHHTRLTRKHQTVSELLFDAWGILTEYVDVLPAQANRTIKAISEYMEKDWSE